VSRADDGGIPLTETIGVVGAGTMGAGIAQVALEAGHPVRIFDPDPSAVDRARAAIATGLQRRAIRRGVAQPEARPTADESLDRLFVASTLGPIAGESALTIEAAIEDIGVKRDLFRALDAEAPASAILATNTSALRVADIAGATTRPERVVGLHFFNPAPVMRLVEVVAPGSASEDIVARATATMLGWGKTPVRSADTPGFIVNRVNRPFTIEALRLVEGAEAAVPDVDEAIRAAGFPMGPFELMDLVGIDVNLAAALGVWEGLGRPERLRPSPIQERLVAERCLGRKTGSGFYRYGPAGERLEPMELPGPRFREVSVRAATPEAIVERIVLAIVNEAYAAVGEGVASSADVDLALRLGAGHPAGPFERVETLGGPGVVRSRLEALALNVGPRFRPVSRLESVE
jgi:3-hydroxybutyryl-CoA dehydrogenase